MPTVRDFIWKFAFLDQSEDFYLRCLQHMIESARQAAAKRSYSEFDVDFSAKVFEGMGEIARFRNTLAWLGLPALENALRKPARLETQQSLTETAIALQRFRLKHGAWPDKLDTLVPEFLPTVPIDYMDGKPIRYRRDSDGSFTLYSVGEPTPGHPVSDESGNPTPWKTNTTYRTIWDGRDAVWPKPATKEETEAFQAKQKKKF